MKGRFIVLEGIDGCGKTTQANYLKRWLPKSGLIPNGKKLHLTREPGGTELGKSLRELLLDSMRKDIPDPNTELLLYAADRAQHVAKMIRPALDSGDWVISDRFSGSTMAYQGYGRKLDLRIIDALEEIATQGLYPDITLLLDIEPRNGIKRRECLANDRIEAEGLEFLQRVALGFNELAKNRSWIKINGNLNANLVSNIIQNELLKNLKRTKTNE